MGVKERLIGNRDTVTSVIADSASLGAAIDCGGFSALGVVIPSGWDTNALSFQVSADGSTYVDLEDENGNEYSIPGALASKAYPLDPPVFAGWRYLKPRSGTSAAAVTQSGAVTLTFNLGQVLA